MKRERGSGTKEGKLSELLPGFKKVKTSACSGKHVLLCVSGLVCCYTIFGGSTACPELNNKQSKVCSHFLLTLKVTKRMWLPFWDFFICPVILKVIILCTPFKIFLHFKLFMWYKKTTADSTISSVPGAKDFKSEAVIDSESVLVSSSNGAKTKSKHWTLADHPLYRKCDQSHELSVTSSLEEALHHLFPSWYHTHTLTCTHTLVSDSEVTMTFFLLSSI